MSLEYCQMCIRTAAMTASGKLKARLKDSESELNKDINVVVGELAGAQLEEGQNTLLMQKLDDLRQLKRGLVEKIGERVIRNADGAEVTDER